MQRCFHILNQLSKHFEVAAIINQEEASFKKAIPYFPSLGYVEVHSTKNERKKLDIFSPLPAKIKNALRYRWYKRRWKGTADGNFLKYYSLLKRILKQKQFNIVILENLDTINAAGVIRRYAKRTKIFYDAHNVDTILAEGQKIKGLMPMQYFLSIREAERNLYKTVDNIFTCSYNDRHTLKQMNRGDLEVSVVPNGVDTTLFNHSVNINEQQLKNIIFCGSLDYEPNKEGLLWFHNNIWPLVTERLPGVKLYIVGRGGRESYQELLNDTSVNFIGEVPEVTPYYRQCNVAIAPLLQGSGTRLKILEAMSLGNPVVTTTIGIEGIDAKANENVLVSDDARGFADAVIHLSTDAGFSAHISNNARRLVENKYSWDFIGNSLATFIESVR